MELTPQQRTKVIHDLLVAALGDHVECAMCKEAPVTATGDDLTFTKDEFAAEVKKAVDAATEPLTARITELEAVGEKTAVETAVAEATTELTTKVEQLTKDLEAADVAKKEAEDALTAKIDEEEQREAAAALDTKREERTTFVKGLGLFSEDLVDKSKDRWAAMGDEDWEAQKAEYQEAANRKGIKPQPLPNGDRPSAVTATTEEPAADGTSAVRQVMELRNQGVNTRQITVG